MAEPEVEAAACRLQELVVLEHRFRTEEPVVAQLRQEEAAVADRQSLQEVGAAGLPPEQAEQPPGDLSSLYPQLWP